jgi:RND superfamily putative drug exporter
LIVLAWVLVAVPASGLSTELQDVASNEPERFLPDGAGATRAIETLRARFDDGRTTTAVLVFARDGGLTAQDRALVERSGRDALFASDGSAGAALAVLPVTEADAVRDRVDDLRDRLRDDAPPGLETHVAGPAGVTADAVDVFRSIDAKLLTATALLILLLLLAIYRSPVTPLVPLIVVFLAYSVTAAIVYFLVEGGVLDVDSQTLAVLIVLMFGAGTDYCLLLVARFRERLRSTDDVEAAMAGAVRSTAPPIVAAGGTVVAAMLVLLLADQRQTAALGPVLAIGTAVMVLAGLTLLPALLGGLGRRAFWPGAPRPREEGRWARLAALLRRRPGTIAAITTAALALGALGNLSDPAGIAFGEGFRSDVDSDAGQSILDERIAPGLGGRLDVIVAEGQAAALAREVAALPAVRDASVVSRSRDGRLARIAVVPATPPLSDATQDLVRDLRVLAPGAPVGGPAAEKLDGDKAFARDGRVIFPAVLAVIALILVALLRAVVAPLYLVATVVVSFACALGLSVLAFEHVLGMDGVSPALPTFAFVFLVALGVDYNLFLMSRAREEVARHGAVEGALRGLTATGAVITSAGLVLAGTFAALMVLPLDTLFQLGFTVALGLLIDALLVRTLLVPALAVKLGPASWWPARARP